MPLNAWELWNSVGRDQKWIRAGKSHDKNTYQDFYEIPGQSKAMKRREFGEVCLYMINSWGSLMVNIFSQSDERFAWTWAETVQIAHSNASFNFVCIWQQNWWQGMSFETEFKWIAPKLWTGYYNVLESNLVGDLFKIPITEISGLLCRSTC